MHSAFYVAAVCSFKQIFLLAHRAMGAASSPRRPGEIVVLGLDNAGKTTLLRSMQSGELAMSMPNIKTLSGCESAVHGSMTLSTLVSWDLGGRQQARALWRQYYKKADALVFVVDCTDRRRCEESQNEFEDLLKEEDLLDKPVLIYANKQDRPSALSGNELADLFGLRTLQRKWHVQESSIKTGTGVHEGLEWLTEAVATNHLETCQPAKCSPTLSDHYADDVSTADTEDASSRAEVICADA